MINETILAAIAAFVISAALCPAVIPFLRKLKFGQQVRDCGPESHLKKQGTPTMGGLVLLAAIVLVSLFYIPRYPAIVPVLFVTVGFGAIGLLDDYIKVVRKHSEGLNPLQKLIGQFAVTGIFVLYLVRAGGTGTSVRIPFAGGRQLDLGLLYVPFAFLTVLGTDNGVNFTDGLDGLCCSVTVPVALFLTAASLRERAGISPLTAAAAGSLLGFLMFNAYPAKVFMGDTGSLALGGFVAASALSMGLPLFIPVAGFIYLLEVLSVILQVVYFKATGGKRIFRMAPIHHHFELGGWSETRVAAVFSAVTAILCLAAYMGL